VLGGSGAATGGGRDVDRSQTAGPSARAIGTTTTATAAAVATDLSFTDRLAAAMTVRNVVTLLAVVVGLLAAFAMPITASLVRLRRRRAAGTRQELIEVEWADLVAHLDDLGLTGPVGATLRQVRERYIRDGYLDPDNATAMRRVTATLEKARYDRPERTSPEEAEALHRDIRAIRRQVNHTRAWQARLRSFLWPQVGVDVWRSLGRRLGRGR
jgi:hypothetical protein